MSMRCPWPKLAVELKFLLLILTLSEKNLAPKSGKIIKLFRI